MPRVLPPVMTSVCPPLPGAMPAIRIGLRTSVLLLAVTAQSSGRAGEHFAPGRSLARCGPLALQVCCAFVGRPIKAVDLDQYLSGDPEGSTLGELDVAARQLGFSTVAVRWSARIPLGLAPALLPIVNAQNRRHFIAMLACRGDEVLIADVPFAPTWLKTSELSSRFHWEGEALHIAESEASLLGVRERADLARRRRRAFFGFVACCSLAALALFSRRRVGLASS